MIGFIVDDTYPNHKQICEKVEEKSQEIENAKWLWMCFYRCCVELESNITTYDNHKQKSLHLWCGQELDIEGTLRKECWGWRMDSSRERMWKRRGPEPESDGRREIELNSLVRYYERWTEDRQSLINLPWLLFARSPQHLLINLFAFVDSKSSIWNSATVSARY